MAPTSRPRANNRKVLKEYSPAMLRLLALGKYNAGKRPSEHAIGRTSFLTNNTGAIPSNVLTIANTTAKDEYLRYCRTHGLQPQPARMPLSLADFFIRFLTSPRNLVLDPFAGSKSSRTVHVPGLLTLRIGRSVTLFSGRAGSDCRRRRYRSLDHRTEVRNVGPNTFEGASPVLFSLSASLKGELPNIRAYSRLNCDALLYPTLNAAPSAVSPSWISRRLASSSRRRF